MFEKLINNKLPGHTQGSVVLLDEENRLLFTGDAANSRTLLVFDYSAAVGEYYEALKKLKKLGDRYDKFYTAHPPSDVKKTCLGSYFFCLEISYYCLFTYLIIFLNFKENQMNLYSGVLSFLKDAERLSAIAAWRNKKRSIIGISFRNRDLKA